MNNSTRVITRYRAPGKKGNLACLPVVDRGERQIETETPRLSQRGVSGIEWISLLCLLRQLVLHGIAHQIGDRMNIELAHQIGAMPLDGFDTDR